MLTFTRLQEDALVQVLEWRRQPEVTAAMLTDVDHDLEKHRQWFARISGDPTCRYWLIRWHGRPIGVLNLAELSQQHRRCNAGYYIGDLSFRQLGAVIPPYLYNHVFKDLGLNKIFGEVLVTNDAVRRIHSMHGYREVGTYRQHVVRRGELVDVVAVELLAETWLALPKYRRYVADFGA